jgi:hypothetical protein
MEHIIVVLRPIRHSSGQALAERTLLFGDKEIFTCHCKSFFKKKGEESQDGGVK